MRRRPVIALATEGWSGKLGDVALDHRRKAGDSAGESIFNAATAVDAVALAISLADAAFGRREVGDM